MKVRFKCPLNGVPIVGEWGEWKERGEWDDPEFYSEVIFDLNEYDEAYENYTADETAKAQEWCDRLRGHHFDYKSESSANYFLELIGIKERWSHW